MGRKLFNTLHPMLGKGIFLPLGEWDYDGRVRQRLDRPHAEAIANELNGRIARGEPGIPVYAGHPDVPELAARYPDKGALGWIVSARLANEGGTDGLALAVEWDRDPGRGFRWFSPYWLANEREGDTWIVDAIASVGLVNNPNIPAFRLANEGRGPVASASSAPDLNEPQPHKEPNMDKTKLIQLLGLAEDASDEDVLSAIEALKTAAADADTKRKAAEAEKASAEEEKRKAEEAFANERTARTGLLLDRAVAEGRIGTAARAAWEERLSEDFAAGSAALANERPLKRETAVTATPATQAKPDLVALANERMKQNPRLSYTSAFAQVMAEHPEIK